jgi:hypothetical protein
MRFIVLLTLFACACALVGALSASAEGPAEPTPSPPDIQPEPEPSHAELQAIIDRYRHRTWHWQRLIGHRVTRTLRNPPPEPQARIATWRRVAGHTRWLALHPPHQRAWACIHEHEGTWTDPSAPYYGGLQMDLGFQRTYGRRLFARKGTADHWTPLEQIWVAERAYRAGRGFYPWPNTARSCGLI